MEDGGVVKKERRMKDIEEKKIKKITLTKKHESQTNIQ